MKKSLTKLIASCAAVAAVSTAMAISASAATYNAETKVVTPEITSAAADGAQATILVYKADSAETEATAETILYIDQTAKTADLWKELSLDLADGKYVIKMGGEAAAVASEVLTVGAPAGISGDYDASTVVDLMDASTVVDYKLGKIVIADDVIAAADTNGDAKADLMDASNIVDLKLGKVTTLPIVAE